MFSLAISHFNGHADLYQFTHYPVPRVSLKYILQNAKQIVDELIPYTDWAHNAHTVPF